MSQPSDGGGAGTSGATAGAGGGAVGGGGTSSMGGTPPTGSAGTAVAGSMSIPTYTWGGVTAQGRDCYNPGLGTCCHYDFCFSPERAAELLSGTGGGGAGGAAGVPLVECPQGVAMVGACAYATPRVSDAGECCFDVQQGSCCGRRLVVAGQPREAELCFREDWLSPGTWRDRAELSEGERTELAAAWAEDALMEHASVASFARFALELLNLGASADLVEDAQRASLDEVTHARLCFHLASGFAGKELGPSALNVGGAELDRSLTDLAVAVLLEGAIGETLAAALASEQLLRVGDEQCRAALEVIARDEAAHALLAWRFLRYAVHRGGSAVGERLREAAAAAPRHLAAKTTTVSSPLWNHYGRLSSSQQREVVASTWRDVIAPGVQLLCGEPLSLRTFV